jgi:hypothetical protein
MDVSTPFLAGAALAAVALIGVIAGREILRRLRIRRKIAERLAAIARENGGR